MALLVRLQAYFKAVEPLHTIDVLPIAAADAPQAEPATPVVPEQGVLQTAIFVCTPAQLRPAPPVAGVEWELLTRHSPLAKIRENLDTNARGFDPGAALATADEAEAFRAGLTANVALTARLHGQPVAAGMFTPPVDGIAELVGLTTLAAQRRRGIGAALTSELARAAFRGGVDLAILRTDNADAARIYARLGFMPAFWLLARPAGHGSASV